MMWKSCTAAVLLTVALSACGSEELVFDKKPGVDTISYSCDGDKSLTAVYVVGTPSVDLTVGGQTLVLPQVPADSGVAYSDGHVTFRTEGQEAFTQGWPGGDFENCSGGGS